MMRTKLAFTSSLVVLLTMIAAAQQLPTPMTSAVVAGVVVVKSGETSTPLRRAAVTLRGGSGARPRVATTDDEGRFRFGDVGNGRYLLTARASGYVGGTFGVEPGLTSPGSILAVTTGTRREDLELVMARGAVVTGRVRGPDNEPFPAANVTLLKVHRFGSEVTTTRVASTRTDDLGEYRFFGLAPGVYTVAAINTQTDVDGAWLIPGAWFDAGPRAPGTVATPSDVPATRVTIAPTYTTATADPALAQHVTVGLGEERSQVDVQLLRVEAAALSGTVALIEGVAPNNITLNIASPALALGLRPAGLSRLGVRPTGAFASEALPPGTYQLKARAKGPEGKALWADAEVTLRGNNVIVPTMQLSPAIRLEGVIDTSTTGGASTGMRVRLSPLDTGNPTVAATADADGAFAADGLLPGRYRAEVTTSTGAPVALTQLSLRGVDGTTTNTLGDPLITIASLPGVVTLAARVSASTAGVRGVVKDGAGRAVTDYTVILFSRDESQWRPEAWTTRLVRPDNTGVYVVDNLPAGDYAVAVMVGIAEDTLSDPSIFRALVESGLKVTVTSNTTSTVDLVVFGR